MQQIDMSNEKPMGIAGNVPRVRYSAAYPTGRERMLEPRYGCARAAGVGLPERSEPEGPQGAARECKVSSADVGLARLSSAGSYSVFSYGDDVIRFATSPRLVKYTRIKQWNDGYLEVGADYGKGEVEDYIDMRAILDNLYYDTDAFLSKIDKVEVVYE